ncbi:predicted protein [Histoplasma capsulatum var. duboisii H88]|uniref:Predicted protein n=1 Tax=Ajellomyces capsulatus (strain H88) TaxID=544711 RepID=F0UBM1_AJEC8|nr:predicted protein [Histoplasma capsulatum var. duboisii H88]
MGVRLVPIHLFGLGPSDLSLPPLSRTLHLKLLITTINTHYAPPPPPPPHHYVGSLCHRLPLLVYTLTYSYRDTSRHGEGEG